MLAVHRRVIFANTIAQVGNHLHLGFVVEICARPAYRRRDDGRANHCAAQPRQFCGGADDNQDLAVPHELHGEPQAHGHHMQEDGASTWSVTTTSCRVINLEHAQSHYCRRDPRSNTSHCGIFSSSSSEDRPCSRTMSRCSSANTTILCMSKSKSSISWCGWQEIAISIRCSVNSRSEKCSL